MFREVAVLAAVVAATLGRSPEARAEAAQAPAPAEEPENQGDQGDGAGEGEESGVEEEVTAGEEAPEPDEPARLGELRTGWVAAWATLGIGLTVAGLGGSLLALAYEVHQEAWERVDQDELDRTFPIYVAGWAALGLGVGSLVASVVLFSLFDRVSSRGAAARGSTAVAPLVGHDLAGLGLVGFF